MSLGSLLEELRSVKSTSRSSQSVFLRKVGQAAADLGLAGLPAVKETSEVTTSLRHHIDDRSGLGHRVLCGNRVRAQYGRVLWQARPIQLRALGGSDDRRNFDHAER